VLFSTACFAVMLGLNISAALKSVIAIYITIPFVLVPLILLSGIIVKYDKMHYSISSSKYVPFVGDVMASRWAYEALMVNQFKNNAFQKNFYPIDLESANLTYVLNFLIPELYNKVSDYEKLIKENQNPHKIAETASLITNTMIGLKGETNSAMMALIYFKGTDSLNTQSINSFLNKLKAHLIIQTNELIHKKDSIYADLMKQGMSNEDIIRFKEEYFNKGVADMVLNTNEMTKILEHDGSFVRKYSPIYQYPLSKTGRAQFYSGTKRLGSLEFDTLWFNIMILWIMTMVLYFMLLTDLLKKTILKFSQTGKRKRFVNNSG
jgi:hypothetical protein